VVTGRVVSIEADGTGMLVQVGKKSLSFGIPKTKNAQTPKVGDTVRVNYTAPEFHARYDPDGTVTKIEGHYPKQGARLVTHRLNFAVFVTNY
jgi:hypothetical protein